MQLVNSGKADDQLIAAASPAAAEVQLHTTIAGESGVMMRLVGAITVPAGGRAELKPGGYHVMLVGPKAPLRAGSTLPLTLTFAHAGSLPVEVQVETANAAAAGD